MKERRLILIIFCILLITIALLSFFLLKDMFANGNNTVANIYATDRIGEQQDRKSSSTGSKSENSNPVGNNIITSSYQPAPAIDNKSNISTDTPGSNSILSDNGTEVNEPTVDGVSVTPVPSLKLLSNERDNKSPGSNNTPATPTPTPPQNMLNVLFLGIDRTEAREKTRVTSASDTIMLARINLDSKTVKVLSIPRDTYAYIPVTDTMDKMNSAYAYGALQGKAVKSIKDAMIYLLGDDCRIDYYFTLDMEPIPDIIDDLGGVEVNVEIDMQSHGVNLIKGLQVLDGKSAYDYLRWRYADDGDIGRIRRQQGFIKALFSKLKASDMENELLRIILSYGDYINTDLGLEQIDNIIQLCAGISEEDIQFYVLPGEGKDMNDISYWMVNEEKMKEVLVKFLD